MLKKKTAIKPNHPGGAVLVSDRLQKIFIGALALQLLVQLITYVTTLSAEWEADTGYMLGTIGLSFVLPVSLFLAAYMLGPKYISKTHGVFIASVKAITAMMVFLLLNTISLYATAKYLQFSELSGLPPLWATSNWPAVVIGLICLIGLIVIMLTYKKGSK